nr:MAG TPA: hypothetical protein [Caudoviricetes sp.]
MLGFQKDIQGSISLIRNIFFIKYIRLRVVACSPAAAGIILRRAVRARSMRITPSRMRLRISGGVP